MMYLDDGGGPSRWIVMIAVVLAAAAGAVWGWIDRKQAERRKRDENTNSVRHRG